MAAVDGPNLSADYFRIKIWTASGVIYDNQAGAANDAVAAVPLTSSVASVTVK